MTMNNLTNMKIIKNGDNLEISLTIPLMMSGENTYGDGKWDAPAVCILINEEMDEYGLFHTQYLDYKDSLQATAPIIHFNTKEESLKIAEEFNLSVEYQRTN
ncbi:MAG: hypothetical protein DDT19_01145 [Syntrophomonadaceae bacterium]|nr:hypothetical protein [Bacillota bacterium]